jgi:AraC-like DNA-binding protein
MDCRRWPMPSGPDASDARAPGQEGLSQSRPAQPNVSTPGTDDPCSVDPPGEGFDERPVVAPRARRGDCQTGGVSSPGLLRLRATKNDGAIARPSGHAPPDQARRSPRDALRAQDRTAPARNTSFPTRTRFLAGAAGAIVEASLLHDRDEHRADVARHPPWRAGSGSSRCVRTCVQTLPETPSARRSVPGVTGYSSRASTDRVVERRRAVSLARHYREFEGLSIRQIADRLGRSPATVKAYFYDPTGEKARAVKARYVGVCRGCGAYTQPRNGKGDAYAYCKVCHPGAIERRWTRELVISAMLEWRERFGRMPSSYDWSRTHASRRGKDAVRRLAAEHWPSASVVTAVFGTWALARAAAAEASSGDRRPRAPSDRGAPTT